jgi:succinoglycan biosynthesis protein ExoA
MSTSSGPRVSVIIPARGAAGSVAGAIESALAQGPVTEVIVAAADFATRRAAAAVDDPRVRIVDNHDGSTPIGLNLALAAGDGDVVVRCDAHSRLPDGYVDRALDVLERTGAVNVGGRQVPRGVTGFERAVAAAMTSRLGAGDARYRIGGEAGPVDTVYLGVFRRGALEAVGGFDETLERNQDYELNWRLRRADGVVWFDPAMTVDYRPRGSVGDLWRQYFGYGLWKWVVLRRHPESLRWRQLAAPALVAGLAASALISPMNWRAGAALPGVYLLATGGAGLVDAFRLRDVAAVREPVALWTMHLAWGLGFIAGLLSGKR